MRSKALFLMLAAAAAAAMSALAQDYPQYRAVASTFVPLDSWVYPAFEHLSALGYVTTAMSGMKPWSRTECARLTEEAGDTLKEKILTDHNPSGLAVELHAALEREFRFELEALGGARTRSLRLESVYARWMSISGPPLTDGFHFGQSVSYDFGRPFRRGTNALAGSGFRASAGPVALYVQTEFQHSPAAPPLSDRARSVIALRDETPLQPAQILGRINRMRLLDTYISLNLSNWQVSFGKQSLWWGPGLGGALLFSNNAEPLYMVRLTRVVPLELPTFFRLLGPLRIDQFIGRAQGYTVIPRPYIYGQKISLRPSPYFEIGFARTVILGGRGGDPFTAGNFLKSFFGREGGPGGPGVPGDSRSAVDWSLRIPGLRNYLVVYSDGFADDDELPYVNPPRATFRPGVYLTRVPGAPQLDLRIEATTSESPGFRNNHGNLNYWNAQYRDGYTNNGFLLGNTVGRQGRTIQFWCTYWFSSTNNLQFSFKNRSVSADFIPGGGNWQDYSVSYEIHRWSGFYLKSFVQFEHIGRYPVLFSGKANNVTTSIELGFIPQSAERK